MFYQEPQCKHRGKYMAPEVSEIYFFDLTEISLITNLSVTNLRKYIRSGKLKAVRTGDEYISTKEDILDFLEREGINPLALSPKGKEGLKRSRKKSEPINLKSAFALSILFHVLILSFLFLLFPKGIIGANNSNNIIGFSLFQTNLSGISRANGDIRKRKPKSSRWSKVTKKTGRSSQNVSKTKPKVEEKSHTLTIDSQKIKSKRIAKKLEFKEVNKPSLPTMKETKTIMAQEKENKKPIKKIFAKKVKEPKNIIPKKEVSLSKDPDLLTETVKDNVENTVKKDTKVASYSKSISNRLSRSESDNESGGGDGEESDGKKIGKVDSFGAGRGTQEDGGEDVYRPGSAVSPPQLVKQVKPNYTERARELGIQGEVLLETLVLKDGSIGEVKVTRSLDQDLNISAIRAVKQWEFLPARKNGNPVDFLVAITVNFEIQ